MEGAQSTAEVLEIELNSILDIHITSQTMNY
jgi:hypothetical protein